MKKWRVRSVAALGASVLVMAASGVSGYGADATSVEEAQRGGELTFLASTDAPSLDTPSVRNYLNGTLDGSRAFAIYDTLFTFDPSTGEIQPQIAESLTSTDGGSTFTLTLREGVEFSDGTPYDAEAVKFNWERLQVPELNAATASVANMIGDMEAVDARTLEFTVTPATPRFINLVTWFLGAVGSPTAIEEMGTAFGEQPVGAGPFVVEEWQRDSHLVLARNENYWNEGLPYLDRITFRIVGDEQQRLQALVAGDGDVMNSATARSIEAATSAGMGSLVFVADGGRYLGLNTALAPFDNPLAVEAIRLAVDRETFVAEQEGQFGLVADRIFSSESPFFDESGVVPPFDAVAAQELLDQYAAETGEPLSFSIVTAEAVHTTGEALQALFSKFDNLEVDVEFVPNTEIIPRWNEPWQAGISSVNFVDPFPDLHEVFGTGAARNHFGFSNEDLDAALAEAATAEGDARIEAYREVQRIIAHEMPAVFFVKAQTSNLFNDDVVHGLVHFNDSVPRWDLVWVE